MNRQQKSFTNKLNTNNKVPITLAASNTLIHGKIPRKCIEKHIVILQDILIYEYYKLIMDAPN